MISGIVLVSERGRQLGRPCGTKFIIVVNNNNGNLELIETWNN